MSAFQPLDITLVRLAIVIAVRDQLLPVYRRAARTKPHLLSIWPSCASAYRRLQYEMAHQTELLVHYIPHIRAQHQQVLG
jgi:hypothetical protein